MFEQCYEPLYRELPNLGRIAPVPWDIETFGFGVADYHIDDIDSIAVGISQLSEHLSNWAKDHEVELVGTTVPAGDISKLYFLQSLGFRYIDSTLMVRYEAVQSTTYPPSEVTLTHADENDLEEIVRICGQCFRCGRYHADPRTPKHLAHRRYQDWARRAFTPENPQIILVAKIKCDICAFSIIQIDGEKGYLYLNAVAPQWQGKKIGIGLIASSMRYFQKQGVSVALSKISTNNIPALNMHSFLGARFDDPTILLHWYAPWATHLETVFQNNCGNEGE